MLLEQKKPVLPIKYKTKPGETVIYKKVKGINRPVGIVRSKQESVSADTRSNYQKKVDTQRAQQVRQKYEQNKVKQEGLQTLAALGKIISPSTYFGAAGRALTGDGKLIGNVLDGSGFGDTTANVAFDLAFPFAAKAGVNNGKIFLQNTAPGIFDPYTTFRGSLGYYGDSLLDRVLGTYGRRFHFPVRVRMPELFREEKMGINLQKYPGYENNLQNGRYPWQNTTTDTIVRNHPRGSWDGSDVVVKNPDMYDANAYLSTQPSDTFILKGHNNDPFNKSNYTIVSGNVELLKQAREAGYETLSTPKLREKFIAMQDENLAEQIAFNQTNGSNLYRALKIQKPGRSLEEVEYTKTLRKLLQKRGQPTYKDYVYQSEQTGLPLTVGRNSTSVPGAINQGKIVHNPNYVFYDRSTPFESKLRRQLGISKAISPETRVEYGYTDEFLRHASSDLNKQLYGK